MRRNDHTLAPDDRERAAASGHDEGFADFERHAVELFVLVPVQANAVRKQDFRREQVAPVNEATHRAHVRRKRLGDAVIGEVGAEALCLRSVSVSRFLDGAQRPVPVRGVGRFAPDTDVMFAVLDGERQGVRHTVSIE